MIRTKQVELGDEILLTIAIPTFNGARTIGTMLDILLPQCDDQIEVLISDNCSTDETPMIIDAYMKSYPCITYYRNKENIGADGNFLQCMRLARGKYVHLLSDDDVLTENSLIRVKRFLSESKDMGLVFLETGNFHGNYTNKESCQRPKDYLDFDICTKNKIDFMKYAKHYWGFVSSFIILKDRFEKIEKPEEFFGTYWLQAYIYILCASGSDTYLGIVGGTIIGAGVYVTQSNFDTSVVDGVNYKKMLDFAVENGFDKKQLTMWYVDRICLLAGHGIIKEKANGNKKINKRLLFNCTKCYPKAWLHIYPMWAVPSFVCKWYMNGYRRSHGIQYSSNLNRAGDVSTGENLNYKK